MVRDQVPLLTRVRPILSSCTIALSSILSHSIDDQVPAMEFPHLDSQSAAILASR